MFGRDYFSGHYFGGAYFGESQGIPPVPPDSSDAITGLSGMTGGGLKTGVMVMGRSWQGGNQALSSIQRASTLNAAANADAVITITGVTGMRTVIHAASWSYKGGTPDADAKLTVTDGVEDDFEWDISAEGPGFIPVDFIGARGEDVILTLEAAGAGVVGKINALYSLER